MKLIEKLKTDELTYIKVKFKNFINLQNFLFNLGYMWGDETKDLANYKRSSYYHDFEKYNYIFIAVNFNYIKRIIFRPFDSSINYIIFNTRIDKIKKLL